MLHYKSPSPSPHLAGRERDREKEGGERDRRKEERKGEKEMGGWTGGLRGGRERDKRVEGRERWRGGKERDRRVKGNRKLIVVLFVYTGYIEIYKREIQLWTH